MAGVESNDVNFENIIFTTKNTKWYGPVITFSAKNKQKLSKSFSQGFERPVYWNKYKKKSDNKNATNE